MFFFRLYFWLNSLQKWPVLICDWNLELFGKPLP